MGESSETALVKIDDNVTAVGSDEFLPLVDVEPMKSGEDLLAATTTDREFVEEEDLELDEEARARVQRKKRQQKREQRRKQHEALRKHFTEPEPVKRGTDPLSLIEEVSEETEEQVESKSSRIIDDLDIIGEEEEEGIKSPELSESDDEDYSRRALSMSFKGDFFQNFYFPSLSDISTDSEEVPTTQKGETEEKVTDGKGTTEVSEADSTKAAAAAAAVSAVVTVVDKSSEKDGDFDGEEHASGDESESEESSSSEISFDWPFPLEDEPPPPPKVDETAFAMDMLIEVTEPLVPVKEPSVTEAVRIERMNRQVCIDVLFKILDEVVESAEYVNPLKVLQEKLRKPKLIVELHRIITDALSAKAYHGDLSNKMFEYYRRVGQLRGYDALPLKSEKSEFKRYKAAMDLLDHFKEKAAVTKRSNILLLADVYMHLASKRAISLSTVQSLEDCVRSTLLRKDFEVMPRIVESELRRMQVLRNEISDSRLWLITRQHTLGSLIERKRKFDQITPELTMDQFLNAQRDVTALGTKVEERNYELNRMRDRCTKHVHQLAFIREKMSMTAASLISKKYDLDEKLEQQKDLRDCLLKLKLQHAHLKVHKSEMIEKSGLLYKPALLLDYDETVEIAEMRRERVRKLRNIVDDLENRINQWEKIRRETRLPSLDQPQRMGSIESKR